MLKVRLAMLGGLLCGIAFFVAGSTSGAQDTDQHDRIRFDVVVSDNAGKPVSGLGQKDFTILDDGKQRQIATFASFDGLKSKPEPPAQMIIVIDSVNNGFIEMGYARQGLENFLRENNGRLGQPTTIARLAPSGVQFLSQPSVDGNALANIVSGLSATVKPRGVDALHVSLTGLMEIAKKELNEPGRKVVFWLGPGWPTPVPPQSAMTDVDLRNQRTYFAVSIQISKLLHDSGIVLYGGYTAGDFYMRDFLKPVRKASDVDARILRLNVLAIKSGGKGELPETNRDRVVTDALKHVAAEANSYYEISFEPPKARAADEFHELRVTVDRPGLIARTITGYYNQPDKEKSKIKEAAEASAPEAGPRIVMRPVTVVELTDLIHAAKSKRDGEVAGEIERLQLIERLSSLKLAKLSEDLPGAKSRASLMVVADASVFLDPPKAEIPDRAKPDAATQREIASRAVDYLKKVIPRLPNFYAKRFTTSFEAISEMHDGNLRSGDGILRPAGEFKATVLYRDGKEVVRAEGAEERRLITHGTFGAILSTVIVDAAHSSTEWARWEQGPNGPVAVLNFRVPKEESHYQVSFPSPMAGGGELSALAPTAYHGEIEIDPDAGTILRLVLEADPEVGSAMHRADIMVEYGAVAIGGKVYTCPVRNVSISVGETSRSADGPGAAEVVRDVTRMDDVVFSDYHVFRSEMRIIPD